VALPEAIPHRVLQGLEVAGARVGLIADEQAGHLLLGHGAHAQAAHVEADLAGGEVEDVEAGVLEVALALLEAWEGDVPDGLELVRLVDGDAHGVFLGNR
jgi:hypothetical protein